MQMVFSVQQTSMPFVYCPLWFDWFMLAKGLYIAIAKSTYKIAATIHKYRCAKF